VFEVVALEIDCNSSKRECAELQKEIGILTSSKVQSEKKNQQIQQRNKKLQLELDEERQICILLRKDKETLNQQKEALEQLRRTEIMALEEQVRDLMVHFESQAKIQDQLEHGNVTSEELDAGSMEVRQTERNSTSAKKSKKRTK